MVLQEFSMLSVFHSRALAAALLLPLSCMAQQAGDAVQGSVAAQPLTLDAAVRLATEQSRLVDARAAQARAARDMAVAAGRLPDPVLKAGVNNLPVEGADRLSLTRDFMTMRSLGVSQELTRGDKRRARSERFERQADAADAARSLAIANVQRDTAIAWLDVHYLGRMRDLLSRQQDEVRLAIDAAEAAYRGSRGTQADVFAARSSAAQLDDRIAQADQQLLAATTMLSRWIGPQAGRMLADAPATDRTRLALADLDGQLAHHPDIAVMAKQEDVARAEADIAHAERQPDWTVELMFNQRGPAYANMVSLNLSIPLPWDRARRQDREEAARRAEVEQMRAEREDATRAHVAEARAMLQEWQSGRERLRLHETRLLPLAADRVTAATTAYRAGSGSLAAVADARRAELDARIEKLKLEMETARLWARLEYLTPTMHAGAQP
jgi:outer membrane protein TolC